MVNRNDRGARILEFAILKFIPSDRERKLFYLI